MTESRYDQYLKLLSIAHYVGAGLTALFACIPFIHLFLGVAMLTQPDFFADSRSGPPPDFVGWLFVFIGGFLILLGWGIAAMMAVSGRFLQQRKNRMFCLVVAGLECLIMPLGTILGVFTLVVLLNPKGEALFPLTNPPVNPPES